MVDSQTAPEIERVFVGRLAEMAEMEAALGVAVDGRGRLVMLAGKPGIGKTRTAQQLGAIAQQRGAQVLWGQSYQKEGAPPF